MYTFFNSADLGSLDHSNKHLMGKMEPGFTIDQMHFQCG